MAKPIMAKATAVWLVDNTTLSFKQIADFCDLHELEVQGIADGDVATGVKGFDPIANNQLEMSEIRKAESNSMHRMKLKFNPAAVGEEKRRGPRYTPLSKRQDRRRAILWLVKFHPELSDGQISKLVGTTKPTIQSIRERTHWNISNIQPIDPVALGLCKQTELDAVVQKAAKKREAEGEVMSDDERRKARVDGAKPGYGSGAQDPDGDIRARKLYALARIRAVATMRTRKKRCQMRIASSTCPLATISLMLTRMSGLNSAVR